MTLSIHQRTARKRFEKERRIKMLERRLDTRVVYAEKFKKGRTREHFMKQAEKTRQELRELDH